MVIGEGWYQIGGCLNTKNTKIFLPESNESKSFDLLEVHVK